MFAVTVALFVSVTTAGLTTFPTYYEDESWNYLAAFEGVKGNGFTWAAFGEGHAAFGVFAALVAPFVAASPFGAERTVRLISAGAGIVMLSGIYLCARRVAREWAWIAPALLVATPSIFIALRHGRSDVVAMALGAWALATAAWGWPLLSGVLTGLAASVHPLLMWVALPCAAFAATQQPRGLFRYGAGAALGVVPQGAWTLWHRDEIRTILSRYAVSTSFGNHNAAGVVHSLLEEPRRYLENVTGLNALSRGTQMIMFALLPVSVFLRRRAQHSVAMLTTTIAPVVAVALLVQTKSAFYVFHTLAFVAIVAAYGLAHLSGKLRGAAAVVTLIALATAMTGYVRNLRETASIITANDTTPVLASFLPRDALVVSPNLYAGLVRTRPDLHFFNYHALSTRPGWGLPACDAVAARLRALVEHDPRVVPERRPPPSKAYLIAESDEWLLWYLRQIYVETTDGDVHCLRHGPGSAITTLKVCKPGGAPCTETAVVRLPI
jgi:hypothetical protein